MRSSSEILKSAIGTATAPIHGAHKLILHVICEICEPRLQKYLHRSGTRFVSFQKPPTAVERFIIMKRTSLVFALFLASTLATTFAASVRYDAKVWSAVQTYDLVSLSKNLDAHMRELVAIKCNFRGKDIRHTKSNWYESSIWQSVAGQSGKFEHIPVMVAKPDLKAFKSIPTDSGGAEITLYGRVEYDVGSKFKFVRLVGRNATIDPSGKATVTW